MMILIAPNDPAGRELLESVFLYFFTGDGAGAAAPGHALDITPSGAPCFWGEGISYIFLQVLRLIGRKSI